MKKTILLLTALAILFGCGNNQQNNKPEPKEFTVETYDVIGDRLLGTRDLNGETYDQRGSFQCTIDIPVTDNQALRDSICNWFMQNFGSDFDGDPRDVKAMVNHFKDRALALEEDEEVLGFDCSYTVKLLEANERYITYSFESFMEVESYPRSSIETNYVTFDRNTGKRFTRGMVNADESLEMLVMDALLEQFFSEWSDDDLAEILVFDPDNLEDAGFWLPEFTDPYLLNNELYFYYWEHDIANRVAGQPYCHLPYNVVEPYLTEEGKAFFAK